MRSYLLEVERALAALPQRTSAHHPESYIGGGQSKLRYLGIRVPDLRQTFQNGFSFSEKSSAEVAKVWDYIWWNSDCYEVMSMALTWFEDPQQRKALKKHWPRLKRWSARIDNWAHSDTLSGIYARLYEESPALLHKTYAQWNRSKNPWLRRLSIVSLLYYSSQREKYPSLAKIKSLLTPQLDFDHYYVQKGVGWTLREAGNVYPAPVYQFVEENIHRISAAAFSAATEKMSPPQKLRLKELRKKNRQNLKRSRP